jgi:hypothetical protein
LDISEIGFAVVKTQPLHEIVLTKWWEDTLIYSDRFFDTTSTLSSDANIDRLMLFTELQMIRSSFELADYPPFVANQRQHLLNSMSNVLLSFEAFFDGNVQLAQAHMQMAEDSLLTLQIEVHRLGISNFCTPFIH